MTIEEKEVLKKLFKALLSFGFAKIIPDIRGGLLLLNDSDEDERNLMEVLLLNADLLNDTDIREVLQKAFSGFRTNNYSKDEIDVVTDLRKHLTQQQGGGYYESLTK